MAEYTVKLYTKAHKDLDDIYSYIAGNLSNPYAASNLVQEIRAAILSLEKMPERGAVRRVGNYAGGSYRQLFVRRYVIVYRVLKDVKEVHVVTVRYLPSDF